MTHPPQPAQPFAQHSRLADRHGRGFMVEHVMELLATS